MAVGVSKTLWNVQHNRTDSKHPCRRPSALNAGQLQLPIGTDLSDLGRVMQRVGRSRGPMPKSTSGAVVVVSIETADAGLHSYMAVLFVAAGTNGNRSQVTCNTVLKFKCKFFR